MKKTPLVYSCSGCSNLAQLANHVAVKLDREGVVEMSCIAGVGAGVAPLVRTAQSGRPIIAIDGCPLACARHCLANQGVTPDRHLILTQLGYRKEAHGDFTCEQADQVEQHVRAHAAELEPAPLSAGKTE